MRTLVLGGSGFLGAHVVRSALDRNGPDGSGAVFSASRGPEFAAVPRAAEHRAVDALAPHGVERLCDELEPTHVILCAALSKLAECETYPGLARALNTEFPSRVARWCASRGARLVFASTDLVFGAVQPGSRGFSEDDAPAPVSVYGRTKVEGERAVLELHPAALVARLALLYGSSHGRGLGASDSLLAALERGEAPCLFTDEWRTPLSVEEASRALIDLAHADASGRLHLAGGERCTRHEFALCVLRAHGWSTDAAARAIRAGTRSSAGLASIRPADVALDSSRAWSLLGRAAPCPSEDLEARMSPPERRGSP